MEFLIILALIIAAWFVVPGLFALWLKWLEWLGLL